MAEKKFEKGKETKGLMMPGKKIEHPGKLFVRLMKYVLKNYTFSSVVVVALHYCQRFGKCTGNDVHPSH